MMAYKDSCDGCPRVSVWSSPTVKVQGAAAGNAESDNARVIAEQAGRLQSSGDLRSHCSWYFVTQNPSMLREPRGDENRIADAGNASSPAKPVEDLPEHGAADEAAGEIAC